MLQSAMASTKAARIIQDAQSQYVGQSGETLEEIQMRRQQDGKKHIRWLEIVAIEERKRNENTKYRTAVRM